MHNDEVALTTVILLMEILNDSCCYVVLVSEPNTTCPIVSYQDGNSYDTNQHLIQIVCFA